MVKAIKQMDLDKCTYTLSISGYYGYVSTLRVDSINLIISNYGIPQLYYVTYNDINCTIILSPNNIEILVKNTPNRDITKELNKVKTIMMLANFHTRCKYNNEIW